MHPIYFYDPGSDTYKAARRNWHVLPGTPVAPTPIELLNREDSPLTAAAELSVTDVFVCIIHLSRLGDPATANRWASEYGEAFFIVISGSTIMQPDKAPQNLLYYPSPVGTDLTEDPFTHVFRIWYSVWNIYGNASWQSFNIDLTAVLALRVLCEASTLAGEPGKVVLDGITVSAPITPDDWTAPFGMTATTANTKRIAATMSIARSSAQQLFEAIVSGLDLSAPVQQFLRDSDDAFRRAGKPK